ncbi:MAG: MBL fold metallo-hydrolase [Balneolaceae bacterium]
MKNIKPLEMGNLELYPVESGRFMLDGGAMFGVVPKTLWSRAIPADEKNRIPMAMRCLLVKSKKTEKIYLVDNGCGDKFSDKMSEIYSLDYQHSKLHSSLEACGVTPDEITDMVFTHLHFDHCGGTTSYKDDGSLKEVFPNAVYHVNEQHWKTALNPNKRETASFFDENILPVKESGKLNLVKDGHRFEEGFSAITMNGHTKGQQLPLFTDGKKTIVYAADLIPTFAHVPLPWIMGYDMSPLQTLSEKEKFLENAVNENWYLFLEHDASNEVITISKENGKFSMGESLSLNEIS